MDIGKKIKQLRKERNITQSELGKRMGISQQQIVQYENGRLNPKLETLHRIADALQIPHSMLYNDISPKEKGELVKRDIMDIINTLNLEIVDIEDKSNITEVIAETAEKKRNYIKLYDKLNTSGQSKAIEQVELLTKIPEYQKDTDE